MTIQLPKPGDLIAGRYRIIEKIGEGGYGSVYKASQDAMGRNVALKILDPEIAERDGEIDRFRREVFHASALHHPNTITLHDFGEFDGLFFIAMEYLEGTTLREELRDFGPKKHEETYEIVIQILKSLREAHERSIVHRDLKPDNIFLCAALYGERVVKVLDFGLSKQLLGNATEPSITTEGTIFGTPQYMSPEQAYGERVCNATDIYALGLLTYEIITGECAFDGKNPKQILLKQVSKPLPLLPIDLRSSLLAEFIRISSEKNIEDRFENAGVALQWLVAQRELRKNAPPIALKSSTLGDGSSRPIPKRTSEAHRSLKDFETRVDDLPFIAKDKELESLLLWSERNLNKGGLASIVGDIGLGKSKLIDELESHLKTHKTLVFRGAFTEGGRSLCALRDALNPIFLGEIKDGETLPATLSIQRIRHLFAILNPDQGTGDFERMVGVRLSEAPTDGVDSKESRFNFIESSLFKLAKTRPIVLILEDIHFADPLSQELIAHWRDEIANRHYALSLVISSRSSEGMSRRKYETQNNFLGIELTPLDDANSRRLLNYLLPIDDDSTRLIFHQTGGNPLFMIELLRSFTEEGDFEYQSESGLWKLSKFSTERPTRLNDFLLHRVRKFIRLRKKGQLYEEFFAYSILLGRRFLIRDLRTLFREFGNSSLLDSFDTLVKSLTLSYFFSSCTINYEPALEFRYDILRQSLLDIPDFQLDNARVIHAFIAQEKVESFEDSPFIAVDIANHFHQADNYRDCFNWRMTAAKLFEHAQDFHSALREYRSAEGLLGAVQEVDSSGEKLLKLRIALGLCYQRLGDFGLAEYALWSAYAESKKVGDLVGHAIAGEHLAKVKVLTASYESADEIYRSVQQLYLLFKNAPGVARCEIGLAEISRFMGNYIDAERRFRITIADAESRDDVNILLECSIGLGRCAYGAGRLSEAWSFFKEAREKATLLQEENRVADIDIEMGTVLIRTLGIRVAEERVFAALEEKRKLGDPLGIANAHLVLGMILRRSTRLQEAEFHARRALAMGENLNHLYLVAKGILLLSEISWIRGDIDGAKKLAREAEILHEEIRDFHGLALTKSFLALYAIETGNILRARELTTESLEISGRKGLGLYQAQFVLLHGLIHENEYNLEEAMAHFGEALELAERSGNRETASLAASCLAKVHVAMGDFEALKEDSYIARKQADILGNNIAVAFALSVELMVAKLTNDEPTYKIKLEEVRRLRSEQPGLLLDERLYEIAVATHRFQNASSSSLIRLSDRPRETILQIVSLLNDLGAFTFAEKLRKKIEKPRDI